MIQLTDKDGKVYTDSQSDLRKIWETHYMNKSDDPEDEPYLDDEHKAETFGVVFADGGCELYGWYEEYGCEPINLLSAGYSVEIERSGE